MLRLVKSTSRPRDKATTTFCPALACSIVRYLTSSFVFMRKKVVRFVNIFLNFGNSLCSTSTGFLEFWLLTFFYVQFRLSIICIENRPFNNYVTFFLASCPFNISTPPLLGRIVIFELLQTSCWFLGLLSCIYSCIKYQKTNYWFMLGWNKLTVFSMN